MGQIRELGRTTSMTAAVVIAFLLVSGWTDASGAPVSRLPGWRDDRAVLVVTTTADDGPGSLRRRIFDAGATPEVDTITFNIPGTGVHTIRPLTPLPPLFDPMTIDGTTQPGYSGTPLIEIDCSAFTQDSGLHIATTGAVIRGLAINRADGAGIIVVQASGTVIEACHIGIDPAGTAAIPNVYEGIAVVNAVNTRIGGGTAATRNVISGNNGPGITITTESSGTRVVGNYIGTNAAGTAAVPNNGDGIYVEDSVGTEIGGSASGEGNVISSNRALGVGLFLDCTQAKVQGNVIGEAIDGSPLGNGADGVYIQDATDNLIGGEAGGEGNRIASNGATGVKVFSGERNTISRNSFDGNGWLAIDLGDDEGVSPNDDLDVDTGANGLLNVPVLTSVDSVSGGALVRGVLRSSPNTTFRLECFTSQECDPFDNGEASTFLDAFDVTTDAQGVSSFEVQLAASVTPGFSVVANATDPDGNTSEFSACAVVRLAWAAPASVGGAPRNLTITENPTPVTDTSESNASPGSVVAYNVYRSQTSPVQISAANLVTTSPASKTSMNVPARNGGLYVVTAKYADGSESAGSNEAGTIGSPQVVSIRLQGQKLIIDGSNFSAGASVVVDGLEFVNPAKVKRGGRRVVQKGLLSSGQTFAQHLASRQISVTGQRASLIGLRNRSGAVQVTIFVEP